MTTTLIGADAVRVAGADFDHLETAARDAAGDLPVAAVGSTGARGLEPLVLATVDGRTAFYAEPSPDRAAAVADAATDGELAPGMDAVVEHEPDRATLPIPPLHPLDAGVRDVTGRCGWVQPTHPGDHGATGGFTRPYVESDPDRLPAVHGRGWGDIAHDRPVADVWRRVSAAPNPVVVVSVHDDPGDRLLCESTPFTVLEGALYAAAVVDAPEVIIAVSDAKGPARTALEDAVAALPTDVRGDRALRVEPVPGDHVATEPTMTIEALEGSDRLEARRRPPGPTEHGLHGRATLVHTPRTLAHVSRRLAGDHDDTRVLTVTGDVDAPTTIELPHESRLRDALDAADPTAGVKATVVGGRFGGLTADPDVRLDPDALRDAGLGTDGTIEVIGRDRCVVAAVGRRTAEAADGNCGRCVPCREGTTQLRGQLRAVYDGDLDRDGIAELSRVMAATSLCAYGRHAQRPVRTALDAFADEFAAHANGECPAGRCDMAPDVEVVP